jgi:RNA polymerase sigma-70 factor (ECF subfamily)
MQSEPRTDPEVLLAHAGWMRALAVGLLGDAAAADDVVQEATVAALLHAPSDEHALAPWLSRVVRNFAWRRRRGEQRRADREARATGPAPEPTPAETLERLDLQRALVEAVRAIDEPLRTTLVLRYFEGKSSADIAREQRIPPGTVRWRLDRGLDQLRERLDSRFGARANWALLLTPFARLHLAPIAAAPLASPILTGVFAMNATQLAATAAAVVIVGSIAWWGFEDSQEHAAAAAVAAPRSVAAQPVLELDTAKDTAREVAIAPAPETAGAAAQSASSAQLESVAPKADELTASVDARFVDEHGAPWSDVLLAAREVRWLPDWKPGEGARSGADGRATLRLTLPRTRFPRGRLGEMKLDCVASRAGCATTTRAAALQPGETTHLGDIVLGPGVSVHGRALDENMNALALATIGVAPVELEDDEGHMRRHGGEAFGEVPSARSLADGTFVLEGVTPGALRVWAHAEGKRYAWSAPLQVPANRDVLGLEIVLTPLLASDRIEGRVVAPNDDPIANADIWFSEHSRGSGMSTSIAVDAHGHFGLLVQHDDSTYDFTARDPEQRFAATTVDGVQPGSLEVVIRMHDKRWLALHVHDPQGVAVADAKFELSARGLASDEPSTSAALGEYSIAIPDGKFYLTVSARGFRSRSLGELDAATLASTLDVVLKHAPVIRGRVIANGSPVAGARVNVTRDDPDASGTAAGYRFRFWVSQAELGTTSDAEGRFQLDCDEDHGFWLRATAEGWTAGEVGPLDAATLAPQNVFDVELTKGGAIEGRVILPDGRDGEGTIIAFNHGDASPRTLRAGAKGAFRIEGLAPGGWQVLGAQTEIDPASTTYSSTSTDAPLEWSCTVLAGQTTHFDLDLTRR